VKTIEVKNEYVLSILALIENHILNIDYDSIKVQCQEIVKGTADVPALPKKIVYEKDYIDLKNEKLSESYLKYIINLGSSFKGLPLVQPRYFLSNTDQKVFKQYGSDLVACMFSESQCLHMLYPPNGFCSWHNNADASGYGIMFSWSETGEGDFRYWDNNKKEVTSIPDKKGWNVKVFYFGNYDEPEKLTYHSSSNDCLRYSMAFLFKNEKEVWEDTIEMLTSHE